MNVHEIYQFAEDGKTWSVPASSWPTNYVVILMWVADKGWCWIILHTELEDWCHDIALPNLDYVEAYPASVILP